METIKKLDLIRSKDSKGSRYQWMSVQKNGDLMLDGYDLGEAPMIFWGRDEYEYWYTIRSEWKDTALLLLLKDKFGTIDDAATWFKERGVPTEFGCWP